LLVGVQNALRLHGCCAGADRIWRGRRKLGELSLDFRECIGVGRCDRHPVDGRAVGDGRRDILLENADICFVHAGVVEFAVIVGWLRPKSAVAQADCVIEDEACLSKVVGAKLVAAGFGYIADANDVSGNNNPNGGGTYVGTSTTVAEATTTHIADANTTTSGNVDGNEHPTNTPASPNNSGFGVTFPAPADAGGGGGGGGGLPSSTGGSPPSTGGSPPNSSGSSDDNSPPSGGGSPPVADGGGGHCGHDQAQNGSSNQNGGSHIDADITALLQALQQGNTTAVNNAVAALGNDVHVAAPDGGIPQFSHVHLEHMWT